MPSPTAESTSKGSLSTIQLIPLGLPVEYDDLPDSLFPVRHVELSEANPQQWRRMQQNPLPRKVSPGQVKKCQALRRHLKVKVKNMKPQQVYAAPGTTPVQVPMAIPDIPPIETTQLRWLKMCLSKEERDLYMATRNEWLIAHPEYDCPEDQKDIHNICLETVVQARLMLMQRQQPKLDISKPYNDSAKRLQQARENLHARRADRLAAKNSSTANVFNVAILSGNVSEQMILERKKQALLDKQDDLQFLESTAKSVPAEPKEAM